MQHELSKGRRFRGRLAPLVCLSTPTGAAMVDLPAVFLVALDNVVEKRAEEKIDNFFQKVAQQGSVW